MSTVDVMLMTFKHSRVTCEKAQHSDTFFDGLAIDTGSQPCMRARHSDLMHCLDYTDNSLETERKRRG